MDSNKFLDQSLAYYKNYFNNEDYKLRWITGELMAVIKNDKYRKCFEQIWGDNLNVTDRIILQEINYNSQFFDTIILKKMNDIGWHIGYSDCQKDVSIKHFPVTTKNTIQIIKQLSNVESSFDFSNSDIFDGTLYFISYIHDGRIMRTGGYELASSGCIEISEPLCMKIQKIIKNISNLKVGQIDRK